MKLMQSLPPWLIGIISILAPAKAAVATTFILILADLVTGVWAARRRKEPITSSGFKTTIYKICFYELAILLGFLAQTYLTGTVLPVCNLVTSVIGLTEMTSILENLQSINPAINWNSLLSRFKNTKENV